MIERINATILRAADTLSLTLRLIIIAYIGIERFNFSAIAGFIERATVGSMLLFVLFWRINAAGRQREAA